MPDVLDVALPQVSVGVHDSEAAVFPVYTNEHQDWRGGRAMYVRVFVVLEVSQGPDVDESETQVAANKPMSTKMLK